jgi:hypothetical protein
MRHSQVWVLGLVAAGAILTSALVGRTLLRSRAHYQMEATSMVQRQPQPNPSQLPKRSFTVGKTELGSLGQARASFDFQLFVPSALPAQFGPPSITLHKSQPGEPEVQFLDIRYETGAGHYLLIRQGVPIPYDDASDPTAKLAPSDAKGTATVQGHQAYWRKGTAVASGAPGQYAWQAGPVIVLMWKSVPTHYPNAYTGYFLESDVLTLDQLDQVANSVQPYTGS